MTIPDFVLTPLTALIAWVQCTSVPEIVGTFLFIAAELVFSPFGVLMAALAVYVARAFSGT